ncbi:SRPBCC domain-containing protein [Carnobacterium inhibens]|uniref:SRPBCC domain-containing protein n=1 Tax=Carnobacterium inhibens TaxID=147709 RepID=UPI0005555C5F|nr:SRPBCC domain-containing protein [Carnobacterium inhibens]MCM3512590.1 SRPBCC domain-containing protein [Carnobacterium inhibens]
MENNPKSGRIDTVSKVIDASPQTLYQAFMDPNYLVKWLPPESMRGEISLFEPVVGGRFQLTLTYEDEHATQGKTTKNSDVLEGTFVELIPNQKIVEAGVFESDDPAFAGNMVMTWYFEEVEQGAKVTIVAENVPKGIKKDDHIDGLNSTLENLECFAKKS